MTISSPPSERLRAIKTPRQKVQRGIALLLKGLEIAIPTQAPVPALQRLSDTSQRQERSSVHDLLPKASAIGRAYAKELKSYRDLASEYNCTLPTIQAILHLRHVPIRKAGRVMGKENDGGTQQSKVSPRQRAWMLKQDLAGMPHSEIAHVIGVSRERVRQLCQKAGHPSRRSRTRADHESEVLADSANRLISNEQHRAVRPSRDIMAAAELWAEGSTIEGIAEAMNRNSNSLGVQIARWRGRWPDLFQRRYQSLQKA